MCGECSGDAPARLPITQDKALTEPAVARVNQEVGADRPPLRLINTAGGPVAEVNMSHATEVAKGLKDAGYDALAAVIEQFHARRSAERAVAGNASLTGASIINPRFLMQDLRYITPRHKPANILEV